MDKIIEDFCSNFTHENYNKLPKRIRREFLEQARELNKASELNKARELSTKRARDIIDYHEECRRFHNEIKGSLITKYANQVVLDLGSGKGGDMHKYNKTGKVRTLYCVEPNKEFIKEMKYRIPSAHLRYNLISINTTAQDFNTIYEAIKKTHVDLITMFFSLSFFFENDVLLDRLISTIQKTGPEKFVGTTIDGKAVVEVLNDNRSVQLEDVTIERDPGDYTQLNPNNIGIGREITFYYENSATVDTKQVEYLVDFPMFIRRLKHAGYKPALPARVNNPDNSLFNPPEFFRRESKLFSKLYRSFSFEKMSESEAQENVIQTLIDLKDDIKNKTALFIIMGHGEDYMYPQGTNDREQENLQRIRQLRAYPYFIKNIKATKNVLTVRIDATNVLTYPDEINGRVIDIKSYVPITAKKNPEYVGVFTEKITDLCRTTVERGGVVFFLNYIRFLDDWKNVPIDWLYKNKYLVSNSTILEWQYGSHFLKNVNASSRSIAELSEESNEYIDYVAENEFFSLTDAGDKLDLKFIE
jgi:hypothetical protein